MAAQTMTEQQFNVLLTAIKIPGGVSATAILLRMEDAGCRDGLMLPRLRQELTTLERQGLAKWHRYVDGCGPRVWRAC